MDPKIPNKLVSSGIWWVGPVVVSGRNDHNPSGARSSRRPQCYQGNDRPESSKYGQPRSVGRGQTEGCVKIWLWLRAVWLIIIAPDWKSRWAAYTRRCEARTRPGSDKRRCEPWGGTPVKHSTSTEATTAANRQANPTHTHKVKMFWQGPSKRSVPTKPRANHH